MIEAFKIMIGVHLVDSASRHLSHLANQFNLTGAAAQRFQQQMRSAQAMAIAGTALLGVGAAGIKAGEGLIHAAAQFDQARAKFQALNLGATVNADAENFAKGTNVIGTSASTLMQTVTDMHTVLGDYAQARRLAPFIAKMEFANKAVFGDKSGFNEEQAQNMARVIEMRGGFKSDEEMRAQANYMQRVLTGTGGRVAPNQYLQMLATGGVATRLMSNDVFYYQLEPLVQEMKSGSRVGTGIASAYMNLGQGRTTLRAADELVKLGLVHSRDLLRINHRFVGMRAGAVQGGDMVGTNPLQFMNDVLLPAFAKHGITTDHAIINEMATIFTNRTASALFSLLYQQREKIVKNMRIDEQAADVDKLTEIAAKTIKGGMHRVAEAWRRFTEIAGDDLKPSVVPVLNMLADSLVHLGNAANTHPEAVRWILGVGAGLTALATAAGTLFALRGAWLMLGGLLRALAPAMLALVSPPRLLAAAFRVLLWPFTALLKLGLGALGTNLSSVATGVGSFAAAIARLLGPLGALIEFINQMWPKPAGGVQEDKDKAKYGIGSYTAQDARREGLPWPPKPLGLPGPVPKDAVHPALSLGERGYHFNNFWHDMTGWVGQKEDRTLQWARGMVGMEGSPFDSGSGGPTLSGLFGGLGSIPGRMVEAAKQGVKEGMAGVTVRIDGSAAVGALVPHMERDAQRPPTGPSTVSVRSGLTALTPAAGY